MARKEIEDRPPSLNSHFKKYYAQKYSVYEIEEKYRITEGPQEQFEFIIEHECSKDTDSICMNGITHKIRKHTAQINYFPLDKCSYYRCQSGECRRNPMPLFFSENQDIKNPFLVIQNIKRIHEGTDMQSTVDGPQSAADLHAIFLHYYRDKVIYDISKGQWCVWQLGYGWTTYKADPHHMMMRKYYKNVMCNLMQPLWRFNNGTDSLRAYRDSHHAKETVETLAEALSQEVKWDSDPTIIPFTNGFIKIIPFSDKPSWHFQPWDDNNLSIMSLKRTGYAFEDENIPENHGSKLKEAFDKLFSFPQERACALRILGYCAQTIKTEDIVPITCHPLLISILENALGSHLSTQVQKLHHDSPKLNVTDKCIIQPTKEEVNLVLKEADFAQQILMVNSSSDHNSEDEGVHLMDLSTAEKNSCMGLVLAGMMDYYKEGIANEGMFTVEQIAPRMSIVQWCERHIVPDEHSHFNLNDAQQGLKSINAGLARQYPSQKLKKAIEDHIGPRHVKTRQVTSRHWSGFKLSLPST